MRPFYKKKRFILVGVLLLIIVISVAASAGKKSDKSTSTTTTAAAGGQAQGATTVPTTGTRSVVAPGSKSAADDVTVSTCTNDPTLNIGSVKVKVTNHSSKASNYLITVTVSSADGKTQIDTGNAAVQSLNPNQSTVTDATVTKAVPAGSVCKVSDVLRTAA